MKVAIIGAKGQLGRDCLRMSAGDADVRGFDLPELDAADEAAVESVLGGFAPEQIVNCAAFTNVDACETDRCVQTAARLHP